MTPEEIERGYNNRAAVPEHPRHFETYAAWSMAARERYAPLTDLRYGPGAGERLDLFLPSGPPRGTYLFIHGGYWRALTKEDYSYVAGPLVDEGIAVAVMEYDLCPQVTIGAIVDECRRAVQWLVREGGRHGLGGPLVVGGSSAGGHLAAMMFATDWTPWGLARSPLAGGVSLSGVHDLRPLVHFSFNRDFGLDEAEAWRQSPLAYRSRTKAPFVIACGSAETTEFVRQARVLWDAWPDVRRPAEGPLMIPGGDHFTVQLDYADRDSAIMKSTLALF